MPQALSFGEFVRGSRCDDTQSAACRVMQNYVGQHPSSISVPKGEFDNNTELTSLCVVIVCMCVRHQSIGTATPSVCGDVEFCRTFRFNGITTLPAGVLDKMPALTTLYVVLVVVRAP